MAIEFQEEEEAAKLRTRRQERRSYLWNAARNPDCAVFKGAWKMGLEGQVGPGYWTKGCGL